MPGHRSPLFLTRPCWAKRNGRRCLMGRGHLGFHDNGTLKWNDDTWSTEGIEEVDTKGKL